MRHIIGSCFLMLAASACAVETLEGGESVGSTSDELVGGHVASESEYPSTVSVRGCTGVKVGPRHFLSAAHCFGDPSMPTLQVTTDNNAQNFQTLTVASVNVHPEYTHCSACSGDGSMSDFGFRPDVALIIVQELTPSIPVAEIDPTTVAIGAPVTLTGYGCENGVGKPSGPARLKVGDTQAVDPLTLSGATSIPGTYSTTNGPGIDASAPGLCPGDSGGPLFRTGTNKVIGINALVTYNVATGTPFGNWFTRLDQQSRYDVYGWVTGLINGAAVGPCADICQAPTVFTTQYYSSANIGTTARCYETTANLVSGNCGGFADPRTLAINGTTMSCNGQNWTLPAKRNGGYCVKVSAGENPWAYFTTF
jgi:secreted trypsin-like serine protease